MKTIALSGGFDPIHVGHLQMIKKASEYGRVILILNSDEWLIRKKGYRFMSYGERKQLLESIRYVDMVVGVDDSDGTVCKALAMLQPDYFGNGGDRGDKNTPEIQVCVEHDIGLIYGLGDKIQSSSDLVWDAIVQRQKNRPNGE